MSNNETRGGVFSTAVIPAAGLGTRFLPVTKTVPKELLPVVSTPSIELIAEEASDAGADRLVIITSDRKTGVMTYFNTDPMLEDELKKKGKYVMLHKVRRAPGLIRVESALQEKPLGLGHAVSLAEHHLHDDEDCIAVLLPDDLVTPTGVLEKMAKVRERFGGTVLCAYEGPGDDISSYGVFDVEPTGIESDEGSVMRVKGMVEKPDPKDAPSHYAAVGRYILDRSIFTALREITPGAGGELQLTDAIAKCAVEGIPTHVVVHRGTRHDLGNPGGYIRASVDFALRDENYGPELREWLEQRLQDNSDNPDSV